MKNTFKIILAMILAVACIKEKGGGDPRKPDEVKLSSPSSVTIEAQGGSATIRIEASGDWTVSLANERATWLRISPESGTAGNKTFNVTAEPNDMPDERTAALRIKCGTASASVTVTQKQKDALTQTPSKTQFGAEGGTFTIEVKANIEYSFEIDAGWIHQSATKAITTKTTTFTVDRNDDTRKREGSVTVKSALGNEQITIYQEAGAPSIILSSDNVPIKTEGGIFTVDVNTNVDVSMAITQGADWLSEVTTKAMSTHSYTFQASPNEGYDAREGKITFKNAESGIEATVSVTQMQKDALVISQSIYEIGANGGGISIVAATNMALQVQVSQPSWVHPVSTKSLQEVSYGFIVDANPEYDVRECVITFSGGALNQQVTIRQDGADGFFADFEDRYTLSARSQTLELKSRSSVDIEAQSNADWITVVSTKALTTRSVTLQIAENTADASRTGKVTVSAPTLGVREEVTILQVGAGDIYIPDNTFRALLLESFDTNKDGVLSKAECENVTRIHFDAYENSTVQLIESIQGIEYFVNLEYLFLRGMTSSGAMGNLKGAVDLSANNLWNLNLSGCNQVEVLDISSCTNLYTLAMDQASSLREVILPDKEGLFLVSIYLPGCKLGPELDLSNYPDLEYIYLNNNPGLKKLWLTTGLKPQQLELDSGCTVAYKGDNPNLVAQFKDPVFKEMLLNTAYLRSYDWNGDGEFSYRELERIKSISLWPDSFDGMDAGKVITSFEDVAMFKSLTTFAMSDLYGRVTAPLPDCLGDLPEVDRILIDDCNISGPIPESICKMEKLLYLNLDNVQITGPLPSGIGSIPNLTDLVIKDCPNLGGPIPESLLTGCKYNYINLSGCNFDDTYIVVPSSRLLEHTAQDNNFSFLGNLQREYNLPGGSVYYEYPSVYYKSEADGHGAIHADGEVELYHAATKGPGLDIFLTGDGFTADNNTVGGTLETYLKHLAEVTISMEPYNKLKEYFNVWLIYAHSEREGTGVLSTEGLKFGSYQPNPGRSSTCNGNHSDVISFVQEATGRHEPSGTVAVIMNSSHYGGTCYFNYASMYDAGMAVGYTPAAWMMDLTYVHETLGHGFGHLDDEYEASSQSISYRYMADYWPSAGFGANMEASEDVRWSPFITDPRYGAENLGAYVTQKKISTYFGSGYRNYYRPTVNSIMNAQWNEGGNRFNAPSREAIWQRVHILTHPEENWSSWEDYVNNGYNREDFVRFDLSPASSPARPRQLKLMRNPERILPDGSKVRLLPPPTPPVILNRE